VKLSKLIIEQPSAIVGEFLIFESASEGRRNDEMAPATRELTGNRRTAECTAGIQRIQGILNGFFSVIGFAVSTVQASEGLCSGPSSSRSSNHASVLLGLEYGCTSSGKLTMGVSRENQDTTSFLWGGDGWESRSVPIQD
jgi:hypothetical protein